MKSPFLMLFMAAFLAAPTFAGTGAILPDGSRLVRCEEKLLCVYDLKTKNEAELRWPAECAFNYPAIAATKARLLVGGGTKIFSYDPAIGTWKLFWNSPEGWTVDDIAHDAKNDRTIAVIMDAEGKLEWRIFSAGSDVPGKLYNRRAAGAENPAFDPAGNLYFTVDGDLWKGSIEAGDSEEVPFVIGGERIWPLAIRETGGGNSSGSSAKQILPLGKWIVLELSRAGGSGWGNIIRIPNADAYENHLPLKWDELEDCGSGSDSAVSGDGKKAYTFIRGTGRWYEIDGATGELKPLSSAQ